MMDKDSNGKFVKGHSIRPKVYRGNGDITRLVMQYKENRNEFTMSLMSRAESLGETLLSKAIDMAMEGNDKMMLFLLDKLVNANLMNRLEKKLVSKTVKDIDNSQQFVIEKMGDGEIDVDYGHKLVKTLSLKRETINTKELEEQVMEVVEDKQK